MNSIKFKILLLSDAILYFQVINDNLFIPGSAIKGSVRHHFKAILNFSKKLDIGVLSDKKFRSKDLINNIYLDDACKEITGINIGRNSGLANDEVNNLKIVPANKVFVGEIRYDSSLTEDEVLVLKSAILGLETTGIGRHRSRGYGLVKIEFI